MLKETYYIVRKQLATEDAFQVSNVYGGLTVLAESFCFTVGLVTLARVPHFSWVYWLLQVLLGISIFRFFVILHECGHKTLFQQQSLNTFIGCLVSPLCLHSYISWREIHHEHHRWVGVIDKDPNAVQWLKLRDSLTLQNLFRLFWKTWLPIGLIKNLFEVFWLYPIGQFKQGQQVKGWQGLLSVVAVVLPHIVLIVYLGMVEYLILFGPMLFVFFMWLENMIMPQHNGLFPYLSQEHPKPIPYQEQDSVTRTVDLPPILAVLFAYNFNLHIEHHLFPYAPWYCLPKVKQKLQGADELKYTEVELLQYTAEIRGRDPIELYINALPPHEPT